MKESDAGSRGSAVPQRSSCDYPMRKLLVQFPGPSLGQGQSGK